VLLACPPGDVRHGSAIHTQTFMCFPTHRRSDYLRGGGGVRTAAVGYPPMIHVYFNRVVPTL